MLPKFGCHSFDVYGQVYPPAYASAQHTILLVQSAITCFIDSTFVVADGRLGWPEFAPYDAIHVGAAAPEIPQPLVDQLKPGGRMVIPVGKIFQDLKVVDKDLDGSISVRDETSVRYVPLTNRDDQLRGS